MHSRKKEQLEDYAANAGKESRCRYTTGATRLQFSCSYRLLYSAAICTQLHGNGVEYSFLLSSAVEMAKLKCGGFFGIKAKNWKFVCI